MCIVDYQDIATDKLINQLLVNRFYSVEIDEIYREVANRFINISQNGPCGHYSDTRVPLL